MKHIISEKELPVDYKVEIELAGSYGDDSRKTLKMHVLPFKKRIHFFVIDHSIEIANVPELVDAIDIYNRLK